MLATTCVQQSAVKVTHQAKLRLSSSQKANREAVAAARAGNCPAMAPAVAALVVVALAVAVQEQLRLTQAAKVLLHLSTQPRTQVLPGIRASRAAASRLPHN